MYETRKLSLHSKKRKRNQIENNIMEDCDIPGNEFCNARYYECAQFGIFSEIANRYLRI